MTVAFMSLWILLTTAPAFADRGSIPNGGVGHDAASASEFRRRWPSAACSSAPSFSGAGGRRNECRRSSGVRGCYRTTIVVRTLEGPC